MRYDFSQAWTGWLLVFRPDGLYGSAPSNVAVSPNLLRHVEDLACLSSLQAEQHQWMNRSVRQLLNHSVPGAEGPMLSEILLLQLASTQLRLSLWQTSDLSTPRPVTPASAHFKRFGQKLELDFSRQHRVQRYAKVLGMSEKSLGRVCLAAAGLFAKACIAQRITLEARRLLAHTNLPVQAIAYELGFEEPTNFGKFFRKEAGMTSLAFRVAHAPLAS